MARPSDLAPRVGLFRDQVKFNSDSSATFNFFGTKNDSQRAGFEVRIECTKSVLTDPILCLKVYFQKSERLMPKTTRIPVFVALKPPFKAISAQTVSQILNKSIKESGLSTATFTAKCFRPSATTAAVLMGADPNTTRMRGRWKNDTAFNEHYSYPLSKTNISEKILESNVQL